MSAHRIVIVGAGFGGVYAYTSLHRLLHGRTDVSLTLISRNNYFLFTPLLHEVATGGISSENIVQPIRDVVGCCLDRFVCTEVEKIHLKKKEVATALGTTPYDILVLAPGAQTNFFGVKGAEEHAFTLKDLEDAIELKNHILSSVEAATTAADDEERQELLTFVVIGGGATGVELACELSDFIFGSIARYYPPALVRDHARVILVQNAKTLIPQFPKTLQERSLQAVRKKGIDVRLNTAVSRVDARSVVLSDGTRIRTASPIWVAGVAPSRIGNDDSLVCDERDRFLVNETLQLKGYDSVFVLGDSACIAGAPVPQLAQVATGQAATVARNCIALMDGKPLKKFAYKGKGMLISLGDFDAAGTIGPFMFWGPLCWWLWRTVYLSKMPTLQKKVKVAIDWTFDLFVPRDISKIE